MSKYVWIFGLLLILSSLLATAADKTPGETQPSRLTDIRQESTKTSPTRVTKTLEQMGYISMQDDVLSRGHPVVDGLKSARIDTVYLLGCGTYPNYGDFEDEEGNPSMDGWIGYDYTAPDSSNWHIDTFNCAALDPATPDNHAWWCGQIFEPCSPEDVPGGYGNEWLDYLDWYGTVPDPLSNVTVRVTAMLNYDNEPGYDFLYLEHENGSGMQPIATFNGSNRDENGEFVPVVFEESFNLNPVDYVGDSSDQVHLRWHFQSDGGWSDEDCWGPTDGAAQIDLIEVYFDQGSGQIQVGTTETCESSDPQQWETVLAPGCGNFAKIWPHLHDIDPCFSNNTPVAAFIDDGVVVPGTGGYLCTTWCYGPSGYIVNPEGGLRGPDFHLRNEIWSPILQWPGSQYIRATLSADVYRHESLCSVCPGIFFTPLVRTTADPTGASGWTEWILYDYIYFGGPSWKRITSEWTGFWPEHPEFAQVSLLVWELGWFYGYTGTDGTPAPYFDNICIRVWADTGPDLWIADPRQLAQDNFPEIGTIDYVNLAENHVRFDAGQFDVETHTARDYIRVYLSTLRPGSVILGPPEMHYKLRPNPLFDPFRTAGWPNEGCVIGDSLRDSQGQVIEHNWSLDLPDTGFFYPGDVIHYYLRGQDDLGGDIGTSMLPTDTTGYSLFPGDPGYMPGIYPPIYVTHALPTLWAASPDSQPKLLFWNNKVQWDAWGYALGNLGYREGVDYDIYQSRGACNSVTGLGSRVTATLLCNYETLLYGGIGCPTMLDMDVSLLDSWLRYGDKNMFLTADNLVSNLMDGSADQLSFLNNWISVNLIQNNIRPLIGSQSTPLVKTIDGNPIFYAVEEWIANGGCPFVNEFDAVEASGNAVRIAEFTDPNGQTGIYPYAAAVFHHDADFNAKVIYVPHEFNLIMTPADDDEENPEPLAARTRMLEEVLLSFGHMGSSPSTNLPEPEIFTVKSYPNPFNPSAKIEYHMPLRGELTVKVYNIRGELVRTLIDEVVSVGDGYVMWDGTDGRGQAVASGVYFYETRALGGVYVDKLALIK